jgi:hypothetical protein
MAFQKRHLAIWLFLLLAIGGLVAASLIIVSTDSMAEQAGKKIKVGMTHDEVETIVEGSRESLFNGAFEWDDGSSILVEYGTDGRVITPPSVYRSQETSWEKIKRRAKEVYSRWF